MNTERPPAEGPPKCEHKFVHLETIRYSKFMDYSTYYVRIDRFFCEQCLLQEEKRCDTYSRETPEWYRN